MINEIEVEPFIFCGKGTVLSYTTVYDPPEGYEGQSPYTVAWVRLEEGPVITAQLTDLETKEEVVMTEVEGMVDEDGNPVFVPVRVTRRLVEIGMPVEMATKVLKKGGKRGIISYGYKFRPLLTPRPGNNSETIYIAED